MTTEHEAARLRVENRELAIMGGFDEAELVLAMNAGLRVLLGLEPDESLPVLIETDPA